MREGIVSPRHTPGVYTTPVAFTSAFVFDWDLIVVVQTVKNKASMTLSNMSSSITHQSADLGLDFAKIQIKFDINSDFMFFLQKNIYLYRVDMKIVPFRMAQSIHFLLP